jgi:hypothetical protein
LINLQILEKRSQILKIRKLTESGTAVFLAWLNSRAAGDMPPANLLNGIEETELAIIDVEIDSNKIFSSRYEFGEYVVDLLGACDARILLSQNSDGIWNWLTVVYFAQFGKKTSKFWHYVVSRRGHSGSLAYRHLARTSYEMFWRHRELSLVMLYGDMSTWGDMSEQLTSRQNVAYNRGYIATANFMYLDNGKLRRGAAGRVPPAKKRKPGDRRGRGGADRLAKAVRRLCRTYDTHVLNTDQMIELLPREFAGFAAKANP